MLRGDSLLKALRNWRDITQMELSFRTNLSQNYISELESGRRKGTKETLALIAEKLNVDKSWLIG
jgi:transcriptional regulator with XRE-family HTH domain